MVDIADDASAKQVENRFAEAYEDEVNDLLTKIHSKNTAKSTKFAVKFLGGLLKGFYINLRRHNGELYTRSSFLVVRQSLNMFLRNPPFSKTFDIIADSTFNNANDAFKAMGQENLKNLKVSDFDILTDDSGKRYVSKVTSELTKNHQGDQTEEFEPEGEKRNPNCSALLQRPKGDFDEDGNSWFQNKLLGKNTLGDIMASISKAASLSKVYSNHCIRATCITLLNEAGFEGRHVITISGHRSEESIKSYCRDTTNKQKREMSKFVSEFTTVTKTQSENLTVEFDNSVTEDELVISA
ncbi:KCTD1_15 [Mytilus coruscus]|uniref:KCTD1_15 n=1 Tax=Mytilus coruscus TaxID=42192 RepID=A0A6J8A7S1_MYTCO|nr:KCTD1_15 [Mytilus coruscus]